MIKKSIAVLLPFKNHFTNSNAGSASIWIKDFNINSSYRKSIYIFGNTDNLNDLIEKNNYININFNNFTFKSKNISYVDEFIRLYKKSNFEMIEVHNRPSYIHHLISKNINSIRTLLSASNAKEGGKRAILEIIE